jgi:hypothetical protein
MYANFIVTDCQKMIVVNENTLRKEGIFIIKKVIISLQALQELSHLQLLPV